MSKDIDKDKARCTLSNKELIEKSNEWVSKLAKSGGKDWTLRVPVNFNHDPDMLFIELGKRLESLSTENAQLREALRELVDECEFIVIPDVRTMNHLYKEEVDIGKLKYLVTKAKRLITYKEDK